MFGPTATLNFGLPAPDPSDASAQGMPQPSEAFPATAPDGAAQLAMLASAIPVNYQHSPELSAPLTSPPPPENQQGNQQSELFIWLYTSVFCMLPHQLSVAACLSRRLQIALPTRQICMQRG